ncbi:MULTISPECIES: hypothetical protein [unclassified Mammaliicoccus]|uniref:hypothetical protein n=1 Tax=Mammaliicoccus TaxID=2803850 RepID=UPI001EFA9AA9|nr:MULTISPECIES: hypothetical protein [unclassified Mammaliicoccus]
MGILRDNQLIFYVDKKYDDVYEVLSNLSKDNKFEIKNLFILCASIGFRNSYKMKVEKKGKETRSSYLTPMEEAFLLNLAFTDKNISSDLDELNKYENRGSVKTVIEDYANGGMSLILENAFNDNWDGSSLNENYDHYYYDLNKYILSEIKNIPF